MGRGKQRGSAAAARKKSGTRMGAKMATNPFSRYTQKQKNPVLGRRVRGAEKATGRARAKQNAQRKSTLLDELQRAQQNTTTKFVDTRIGAKLESLESQNVALKRFQRERARQIGSKRNFSLEDDDGSSTLLTHGGRALGEVLAERVKQKEEIQYGSDIEDDDSASGLFTEQNFGGGSRDGTKTQREIMHEVIQKSKAFKAEQQLKKEALLASFRRLDEEYDELKELLEFRPKERPKKPFEREHAKMVDDSDVEKQDEYEKMVAQLADDVRVAAMRRARSPQEQEKQEFLRLQELERLRQQRAAGDAAALASADAMLQVHMDKPNKQSRDALLIQAAMQDASNKFYFDKNGNKRLRSRALRRLRKLEKQRKILAEQQKKEDEFADVIGFYQDPNEMVEETIDGSEDDDSEDVEDAQDPDEVLSLKAAVRQEQHLDIEEDALQRLPYVICAPQTAAGLVSLFENYTDLAHVAEICRRIRLSNAVHLHEDNAAIVAKYVELVFGMGMWSVWHTRRQRRAWQLVQLLTARAWPTVAAQVCIRTLRQLQKGVQKQSRAKSGAAALSQRACLWLLTLTQVWPCSDLRHSVSTPLILVIAQAITQGALETVSQATTTLFLCSVLLHYVRESHRLVPEVLTALRKIVLALVSLQSNHGRNETQREQERMTTVLLQHQQRRRELQARALTTLLKQSEDAAKEAARARFLARSAGTEEHHFQRRLGIETERLGGNSGNSPLFGVPLSWLRHNDVSEVEQNVRIEALLSTAASLCVDAVNLWHDTVAFAELFASVFAALTSVQTEDPVLNLARRVLRSFTHSCLQRRNPLSRREHRLSLLRFEPAIEEHFNPEAPIGVKDENAQREELKRLRRELKQEKKAARRELKKDNLFLARARLEKQREMHEARMEQRKKNLAFQEQLASDTNVFRYSKNKK
ncbi:MAG: hypothetical protein MHM6MM_004385 [Cercozoa sp. M6MM]